MLCSVPREGCGDLRPYLSLPVLAKISRSQDGHTGFSRLLSMLYRLLDDIAMEALHGHTPFERAVLSLIWRFRPAEVAKQESYNSQQKPTIRGREVTARYRTYSLAQYARFRLPHIPVQYNITNREGMHRVRIRQGRGAHLQLWEEVGGPGELAAAGLHVQARGQLQDAGHRIQQARGATGLEHHLFRINEQAGLRQHVRIERL